MVHPTQRREQTVLWLAATPVIDVTSPDALQEVEELAYLRRGVRVIVDVGNISPWAWQLDDRLTYFLVDHARARGLVLELQGTPSALRSWWQVLSDIGSQPRTERHLHAVASTRVRA